MQATATKEAPTRQNPSRKKFLKRALIVCAGSCSVMLLYSTCQNQQYLGQTHIPIGEACAIYNQNDDATKKLETAIKIALPACCYSFHNICRNLKDTIAAMCTTTKLDLWATENKTSGKYLDQWATENKTEECETCEGIGFFRKDFMYPYAHCLLGKHLQVEENGEKQEIVIKNLDFFSGNYEGGSRSAYDLKNGRVILLSNTGKGIWNRMVEEEDAIDKFYQQYIMTSGVKKATFEMNGSTNYALVAKNFASYKDQLGFVIDTKHVANIYFGDMYDREWLSKIIPEPNLKAWMNMMEPMIQQYASLITNGVECPSGDTLNYFYAGEGSSYAKNGKPSVFLFGFDFSSKSYIRTVKEIKNFYSANAYCQIDIESNFRYIAEILMDLKRKTKFSMEFKPQSKDDENLVLQVAAKSKKRLLKVIPE